MADPENRTPIQAPEDSPRREVGRSIAESVVELVPGGGVVTGLLRVAAPPKAEKLHEEWQHDISERSNEHDAQLRRHEDMLAPTETIDGLAAQLISRLVQECPDGLAEKSYDLDTLATLFPEAREQAIRDAASDLDVLGLLNVRALIGGWSVALSDDSYQQIDWQVMGWDTRADAVEIAGLMLSEDTGDAPDLHDKTGWAMRRFYPAFRFLLPVFPEGRIRNLNHPKYPVLGVVLADEDKSTLRRMIAKAGNAT